MKNLGSLLGHPILHYSILSGIALTLLTTLSFVWNIKNIDKQAIYIATEEARANWNKDQAFRRWATLHGGVYVKPDERTPPNPYLKHLPNRDVETTDGVKLTLMNPAYMMSQMTKEFESMYGIKGKITGQILLNPANKADPWELNALKQFDKGVKEVLEQANIDGQSYIRLMRPMVMQEGCVLCHGHLGFKVGDIRGGVSVSIPLTPYFEAAQESKTSLLFTHSIVWSIGMLTIGLVSWREQRREREKKKVEDALKMSEAKTRTIVTSIGEGIISAVATPDLTIDFVNQETCNIFGYLEEELLGQSLTILIPGKYRAGHSAGVKRYLRDGNPKILDKRIELEGLKKDGSSFPLELKVEEAKDEGGKSFFTAAIRDITERKKAEEEIKRYRDHLEDEVNKRTRELNFQKFALDKHAIVSATDANGNITYVNDKFCKISGYTKDEFMGQNHRILKSGEHSPAFYSDMWHTISNGKVWHGEVKDKKKNGDFFWLKATMVPFMDERGKPQQYFSIRTDITEQKIVEEQLRQFASMCINNPAPVFQIYSDSGELAGYPNPAFKKVFKSADKKISMYEKIPGLKDIVNKLKENSITQLEYSIEDKTYLLTIYNMRPNLVDIYGDDITERKLTENLLHHKTELIHLMQKITITGNEASTLDEAMQICLDNICSYTGWQVGHVYLPESAEKLIPTTIWHLDPPEQFKTFRKITEITPFDIGVGLPGKVLASGEPIWVKDVTREPWFLRTKLAKETNVKAGFAFPVLEGEKVVAVLEFFSREAEEPDKSLLEAMSVFSTQLGRMTERKKAEKDLNKYASEMEQLAEERSKQLVHADRMITLGTLSAGVAHEINNPVGFVGNNIQIFEKLWDQTIRACVEKAKGKNEDKNLAFALDEIPKMIKAMREGTRRIGNIVHNLGRFSRTTKLVFEPSNICEVIEAAVRMSKFDLVVKHKVKVRLDLASDIPNIKISRQEMEQVLINLIANSGHAMEETTDQKGFILKINASHINNNVVIEITDNGYGMDEKTLNNIFDPFFTTKDVGRGTGLGLSVCRGIIEQHRGTIAARSTLGKGTTFTIKLPIDPEIEERREKNGKKTITGMRDEDR